jgi:hypothetical protein
LGSAGGKHLKQIVLEFARTHSPGITIDYFAVASDAAAFCGMDSRVGRRNHGLILVTELEPWALCLRPATHRNWFFFPPLAKCRAPSKVRLGSWDIFGAAEQNDSRDRLFKDDSQKIEAEKAGWRLPGVARAAGDSALARVTGGRGRLVVGLSARYHGSLADDVSGQPHEALIMEMIIMGMAANSVKKVMACVQSLHRMCGLAPPAMQAKLFARMSKAIASMTRAPSLLHFPIGSHHLVQMIALDGMMSPVKWRAVLFVLIGTACVSWVDEVALMQRCDLLWDHDAAYHTSLAGDSNHSAQAGL